MIFSKRKGSQCSQIDLSKSQNSSFQNDEGVKYASQFQCFVNLLKSMIGICILDLPYVANQTGYIWSTFLLFIVGILTIRALYLLLDVADDLTDGQIQYGEVVQKTLGETSSNITETFISLNQTCICVAYVIFFGRFFQIQMSGLGFQLTSFECTILVMILILPIIFLKNINRLEVFNSVGLILAIAGIASILLHETKILTTGTPAPLNDLVANNFESTFLFISVTITAIEGGLTLLPVRSVFEDKKVIKSLYQQHNFLKEFRKVVLSSMSATLILLALFSLISIFAYGNQLDQIIIFNLPNNQIWTKIAILIYGIQLMMTYPLQIFPVHLIIDSNFNQEEKVLYSTLTKMALLLCIFSIAYFAPNFSGFLGIMGSIFGTTLTFLIPAVCHWVHFQTKSKLRKMEYCFFIVFSFVCTIIGVKQSIQQLMT